MLAVADGRPRPVVDLSHVADFSTPIAALFAAPQGVRDLEADLGRLSERLAHLFTTDYALPSEHRAEIGATLNEMRRNQARGSRRYYGLDWLFASGVLERPIQARNAFQQPDFGVLVAA
jgi:hypothetical protein